MIRNNHGFVAAGDETRRIVAVEQRPADAVEHFRMKRKIMRRGGAGKLLRASFSGVSVVEQENAVVGNERGCYGFAETFVELARTLRKRGLVEKMPGGDTSCRSTPSIFR